MNQAGSVIESHTYIESLLPAYAAKHHLTERETEIMRLIVQGKDNQNIASELHVALGTVKSPCAQHHAKSGKDEPGRLDKGLLVDTVGSVPGAYPSVATATFLPEKARPQRRGGASSDRSAP